MLARSFVPTQHYALKAQLWKAGLPRLPFRSASTFSLCRSTCGYCYVQARLENNMYFLSEMDPVGPELCKALPELSSQSRRFHVSATKLDRKRANSFTRKINITAYSNWGGAATERAGNFLVCPSGAGTEPALEASSTCLSTNLSTEEPLRCSRAAGAEGRVRRASCSAEIIATSSLGAAHWARQMRSFYRAAW